MNRFFVKREDISGDKIFITDKEDVHHIVKVLRLKRNDKIEISDGIENEYIAGILEAASDMVVCEICEKLSEDREPKVEITLVQGLPKQGKMELIVQKAVELGVGTLIPCIFRRSINSDSEKANKKTDRWQKIAKEAAQQSKRKIIPKVENCEDMKSLIGKLDEFDLVLLAYEDERKASIKSELRENRISPQKVAVIIGPEGGFEIEEVEMLKKAGAISVSLGKAILRTETAGIAAISMLIYALDM